MDVVSALSADPKATSELAQSISSYSKSSPGYFSDMQKKLKGFVEAGQLGIFANAYWGHPAMILPPEVNLLAAAHYLQALEYQRSVNQVVRITSYNVCYTKLLRFIPMAIASNGALKLTRGSTISSIGQAEIQKMKSLFWAVRVKTCSKVSAVLIRKVNGNLRQNLHRNNFV